MKTARRSILGLAMIFMSFAIIGVSAYVYETGQLTVGQNVQNIATITLKNSALGNIEEGQTLLYTKSNVSSLGAAITLTTTKAHVYMHLSSDLASQSASYSTYNVVAKYITVPGGSTHSVGQTAATLTLTQSSSGAIDLDVSGNWILDFEITTFAKSVNADTPTTVTITVTAEST
jgi:hypothetical protein